MKLKVIFVYTFFYKNIVYKIIQAQTGQKIKNILRISSASILAILFCFLSCRSSLCSKKAPVLESLFNKVAGKVYKNTFFYRIPPVAVFVVFATKQPNIQCYNDNFGLYYNQRLSWKYCN